MDGKKIGENHAKGMFRRGLAELQAASYFGESNIAQPVSHSVADERDKQPGSAEPEVAPAPEFERDR